MEEVGEGKVEGQQQGDGGEDHGEVVWLCVGTGSLSALSL